MFSLLPAFLRENRLSLTNILPTKTWIPSPAQGYRKTKSKNSPEANWNEPLQPTKLMVCNVGFDEQATMSGAAPLSSSKIVNDLLKGKHPNWPKRVWVLAGLIIGRLSWRPVCASGGTHGSKLCKCNIAKTSRWKALWTLETRWVFFLPKLCSGYDVFCLYSKLSLL